MINFTKAKKLISLSMLGLIFFSATLLASCDQDADSHSFDYKTDISEVEEILNTTDEKYLILVNKSQTIDKNFAPEKLCAIDKKYVNPQKDSTIELEESAAKAAEAMLCEMRAHNINDVYITSGYRSYAYQDWLFNGHYFELEKEKNPHLSDEEIRNIILTYSAAPGTSEHHTGLCMDLYVVPGMIDLVNFGSDTQAQGDIGFAETEAFEWLKDNAHKFGFILRYPADKVGVTQYSYESWHYRFVGIKAATEIYKNGLCLEEYLENK